MILCTTETVPGRAIVQVLGLVRGNTVRSRHLGKTFLASLRSTVGGEVEEWTKLLAESREQSLDRMVDQARELGADAVIGLRFATSEISSSAAEFMAYGTAVKFG